MLRLQAIPFYLFESREGKTSHMGGCKGSRDQLPKRMRHFWSDGNARCGVCGGITQLHASVRFHKLKASTICPFYLCKADKNIFFLRHFSKCSIDIFKKKRRKFSFSEKHGWGNGAYQLTTLLFLSYIPCIGEKEKQKYLSLIRAHTCSVWKAPANIWRRPAQHGEASVLGITHLAGQHPGKERAVPRRSAAPAAPPLQVPESVSSPLPPPHSPPCPLLSRNVSSTLSQPKSQNCSQRSA